MSITFKERYRQLIAELEADRLRALDDSLKMAEKTLEGLLRLQEAGLYEPDGYLNIWNVCTHDFWAQKEELIKYRKILGPLKIEYKDIWDREEQVMVVLRSQYYPGIQVKYLTRLKGDKCRVEEVTQVERRLVCQS